jgi:hypothetical protein
MDVNGYRTSPRRREAAASFADVVAGLFPLQRVDQIIPHSAIDRQRGAASAKQGLSPLRLPLLTLAPYQPYRRA